VKLSHEEHKIINHIAEQTFEKVMTRLKYIEEDNVPEYLAYRLLNAIEWVSPNLNLTKHIANRIVKHYSPPIVKGILTRHFDLNY